MAESQRIPRKVALFVAYMVLTCRIQLTILTPPSTKRYTLWGWTEEQSDAWVEFTAEAESLYELYSDPDQVNRAVRTKMKKLIKKVIKYDHDPEEGNSLLDMVALNGTVDDCISFNIKRAKSLAKKPVHSSGDVSTQIPRLGLKKIVKGIHVIDVDNTNMPDTKARPRGTIATMMFCCVAQEAPTSYDQYVCVGGAIRGRFANELKLPVVTPGTKLNAYYIARYLTAKGKLGKESNVLIVDVIV